MTQGLWSGDVWHANSAGELHEFEAKPRFRNEPDLKPEAPALGAIALP